MEGGECVGVFAKESLQRFSVLGAYLGLVEVATSVLDSESHESEDDGSDHDGGLDAACTGGKSRKSYDMTLGDSCLLVNGNVYGNMMTYINDHTGISDKPNAAYVDIKVNSFDAIIIVALQDIEPGYPAPCPLPGPRA